MLRESHDITGSLSRFIYESFKGMQEAKGINQQDVVFLGNGRCYHTLDCFHSLQKLTPNNPPTLVTDLIESESFDKLVKKEDKIKRLFVLDPFLCKKQSVFGSVWRNFLKFALIPIQFIKFRKILKCFPNPVIHAQSTYYIFLARFSGVPYVATPQGSELLVRPFSSKAYKLFAGIAYSRAGCITVDSPAMQKALKELYGYNAIIMKRGVDVAAIDAFEPRSRSRKNLLSIRAVQQNYNIDALVKERNQRHSKVPIHFCYPFVDQVYKDTLWKELIESDKDLGRLSRDELYGELFSAKLVVSIPKSDSSPRSVCEAIFCGCFVATTHASWIDVAPECMKSRLIHVDIEKEGWLEGAFEYAEAHSHEPYQPSEEALNIFDQKKSMLKFYNELYPATRGL
jgi:hypothetical protein